MLLAIGVGLFAVIGLVVGLILATRGGSKTVAPPTAAGALVDYLARVDPATRQIVARIPLGEHPIDVAVGEGSVWVLDQDGSVRRIDPVTNKATVIEGVAEDPKAIAGGEGAVWVADGTRRVVHKIDPASNRMVASLPVGAFAHDVTTGENAAWVAAGSGIIRIDPSSGDLSELEGSVGEVGGPLGPRYGIGLGDDLVWQMYTLLPSVGRFEIGTGGFDRLEVSVDPRAIAVSGADVWVAACGAPGTVVRLDGRAGEVIATLAAGGSECSFLVGGPPVAITAGQEGVWVTDAVNGTISRISEATNQLDAPIKIGDTLTAIAVGLGSVWVTVDGEVSPSPSTS
jgi:streptogramin lyase